MDWGAAFEAIRPWLLLAFNGGLLTIAAKLYVDNRGLRLKEQTRAQEYTLEVSADGRSNLQFIIDNLRRDTERADERAAAAEARAAAAEAAHRACEDESRAQGVKLDGVVRQFIHFQLTYAENIPIAERSPVIADLRRQFDELAQHDAAAGGGGDRPARA